MILWEEILMAEIKNNVMIMNTIYLLLACIFFSHISFGQRSDREELMKIEKIRKSESKKKRSFEKSYSQKKLLNEPPDLNDYIAQYEYGYLLLKNAVSQKDTIAAVKWIKLSAVEGKYPPALQELGICYKYGIGVPYDLYYAYQYFDMAASAGSSRGLYARGFMLYKGLGCEQNYGAAFTDFTKCADSGNPSCMYMLALCYRNGFGIRQDTIKATEWLDLAIQKDHNIALEEVNIPIPEINDEYLSIIKSYGDIDFFNSLDNIKINDYNKIIDIESLGLDHGSMNGYWVKYDYSGEHIVAIKRIVFDAKIKQDYFECNVSFEDGKLTPFTISGEVTKNSNKIYTSSKMIERKDRYVVNTIDKLEINELSFNNFISDNRDLEIILGEIKGYSTYEKEPERPIKIFLFKNNRIKNDPVTIKDFDLMVSPNPFKSICQIQFNIETASDCSLYIYNMEGNLVHTVPRTFLQKGKYIYPLEKDLISGIYIISMTVNNVTKQVKIVKI